MPSLMPDSGYLFLTQMAGFGKSIISPNDGPPIYLLRATVPRLCYCAERKNFFNASRFQFFLFTISNMFRNKIKKKIWRKSEANTRVENGVKESGKKGKTLAGRVPILTPYSPVPVANISKCPQQGIWTNRGKSFRWRSFSTIAPGK